MKKVYRPETFSQVRGQKAIVTTLKNAIAMGRVANAYLFTGSRGTGKTTLARILAKALNCENLSDENEPCGTCTSCCEIASGHSLDVLEIDGASNRGIDDIRNLNETVAYASAGKCKVYIIDEVHMLTKEAFNALLKTLEEPPPKVKFFFATTEPHKVLPTILSRCQRFDLARLNETDIVEKLTQIAAEQNLTVEPAALSLIAHLSEGGMRDAESLFDQIACFSEGPLTEKTVIDTLGLTPRDAFFRLDDAIEKNDPTFALTLAEEIYSSGKDLSHFVTDLTDHIRTHLLLALSQTLPAHLATLYTKTPFSKTYCYDALDYLLEWCEKIPRSPLKRLHLEIILLHLIRSSKSIPIDALIHKLLEAKPEMPATQPEPAPKPPEPIIAPPPEPPKPIAKPEPIPEPLPSTTAKDETLLQFAKVELNATIQKP
ncbi:MAG: DNA polymerase III subunit gamma/tau [Simkaniaceae bacterium]|nr:DNA polymerase III subunit gamma/tau [Simkaniaceae bacterium]